MYIVASKVKKKAQSLGYRTDKSFMLSLDAFIDGLIGSVTDWTKPRKTMTRQELLAYLRYHHINLG